MALRNYEIMFLLDSGKYATDPDAVTAEVDSILEKIGAEVVAARPWLDGKLAYEIEGHRKGLHYLVYAKADSGEVPKLQRMCKLSSVVLRYLCILPPDQLFDLMSAALLDPERTAVSAEGEEQAEGENKTEKTESTEEATAESTEAATDSSADDSSEEETVAATE